MNRKKEKERDLVREAWPGLCLINRAWQILHKEDCSHILRLSNNSLPVQCNLAHKNTKTHFRLQLVIHARSFWASRLFSFLTTQQWRSGCKLLRNLYRRSFPFFFFFKSHFLHARCHKYNMSLQSHNFLPVHCWSFLKNNKDYTLIQFRFFANSLQTVSMFLKCFDELFRSRQKT